MAEYLKALDAYLLRQANPDLEYPEPEKEEADEENEPINRRDLLANSPEMRTKTVVGKVSRYTYVEELKMTLSNVTLKEFYHIRMLVSRSNLKIEMLKTDDSLGSRLFSPSEDIQDVIQGEAKALH